MLDPKQLKATEQGLACPQQLPSNSEALESDPFKGVIRIDYINAQRGFSDGDTGVRGSDQDGDVDDANANAGKKLSMQLRSYYAKYLDLSDRPEPQDIQALQALHTAEATFDHRLKQSFAGPLKELELIGYPGVTDPKLTITARIKPIDGLNHGAAVQYEVPSSQLGADINHYLPEDSNGLGYQNLMSMIFKLMSYRDAWRQVGKAALSWAEKDALPPPLHLVLIEEPEAHLHAQVQQVFIRQAYKVLRNHEELGESKSQATQMVVSTHSSHLAHEADFASLRYFRRLPALAEFGALPTASVVNLSNIFGEDGKTNEFVKRYLKATHCDLFFADGAILIEGPAERILIPHLVREREEYKYLQSAYITWLEIGGSHAHRLRPLLDQLGLTTLIITDIDAKAEASETAVPPKRNVKLRARNETLKTWVPQEYSLDALLDMSADKKTMGGEYGGAIRGAYQSPISMKFKAEEAKEALANTFEDALLYTNPEFFAALDGSGLITKFKTALLEAPDINSLAEKVHEALKKARKAEFAMDLMLSEKAKKNIKQV